MSAIFKKFKSKSTAVLSVTALILVIISIATVTFSWVEGSSSLLIKSDGNVSVTAPAKAFEMSAATSDDGVKATYGLAEFIDFDTLFFAPASSTDGENIVINTSATASRPVTSDDINTNYVDFAVKVKNVDDDYRDIKFGADNKITVGGKTLNDIKVAVGVDGEAPNEFFASDDFAGKVIVAVAPGAEVTLRVKMWLNCTYDNFASVAGKLVNIDMSLVIAEMSTKKVAVSFVDKTNSSTDVCLVSDMVNNSGKQLFAVDGNNTSVKYPLTWNVEKGAYVSEEEVPEYLIIGLPGASSSALEYWLCDDENSTTPIAKWKPSKLDEYDPETAVYTAYGSLDGGSTTCNGTWDKVIHMVLYDKSVEQMFTDSSVKAVSFYNKYLAYPMYKDADSSMWETYTPVTTFNAVSGNEFYFNARSSADFDGTGNLLYTAKADSSEFSDLSTLTEAKYTVFGLSGTANNGGDQNCVGIWYGGDVDAVKVQDMTSNHTIINGNATVKTTFDGSTYYLTSYNSTDKYWQTVLPTDINPVKNDSAAIADVKVKFTATVGTKVYTYDGSERTKTGDEFVYSFTNYSSESNQFSAGTWNYKVPTDNTTVYLDEYYKNLYVWAKISDGAGTTTSYYPMGTWNNTKNNVSGYEQVAIEGKTYYKVVMPFEDFGPNAKDFKTYGTEASTFGAIAHNGGDSTKTGDLTATDDKEPLYVGKSYVISRSSSGAISVYEYSTVKYDPKTVALSTYVGETLTLNAEATVLNDGTVTYSTVCTSSNAANAVITAATTAAPTFKSSVAGTYTVVTTATNSDGCIATKTFTITVKVRNLVTDANLLSVLKGEKVMFYYGDLWEQNDSVATKYLRSNSNTNSTVYSAKCTSERISAISTTADYNYAVACVPSAKYFYSNSPSWSGDSFSEAAVAGKAYVDGKDGHNIVAVDSKSGLNSYSTSVTIQVGSASAPINVSMSSATSVIGKTNTLQYYITSDGTNFYEFDPTSTSYLEAGTYTVYPVIYDTKIYVRGNAITLKVTSSGQEETTVPTTTAPVDSTYYFSYYDNNDKVNKYVAMTSNADGTYTYVEDFAADYYDGNPKFKITNNNSSNPDSASEESECVNYNSPTVTVVGSLNTAGITTSMANTYKDLQIIFPSDYTGSKELLITYTPSEGNNVPPSGSISIALANETPEPTTKRIYFDVSPCTWFLNSNYYPAISYSGHTDFIYLADNTVTYNSKTYYYCDVPTDVSGITLRRQNASGTSYNSASISDPTTAQNLFTVGSSWGGSGTWSTITIS